MTKKVPIGLQLFCVRGEVQKDLAATLEAVAKLGYVAAEPWGYRGDELEWMGHKPAEIRRMYDDAGLACCGFHLATDALLGDNLKRTVEMNQILGNNFLIIAADKTRTSKLETTLELAEILNTVADELAPLGMVTGYHAHGFDFGYFGQETAWEVLFSNTEPEVVMQMDIGNCANGGGDPIKMLRKFPGRARSLHLKDYGGEPGSVISEGVADWDTIFELVETQHDPIWYVVEEGNPDGIGFDTSGRSLEALRKMGKA